MTTTEMPAVTECTVPSCSYNEDHDCHAFAITVSGANGAADCATFVPLDARGGLPRVMSQVGACSRADCVHNVALECTASAVTVGSGSGVDGHTANCMTYTPR